jgi:aryl sulfotransferase
MKRSAAPIRDQPPTRASSSATGWARTPQTRPTSPRAAFFDTERTWWAARDKPNMLMVHYTDLKADLDGQMRRIADFLGIETPKSLWPQLVEAATFEAMRREGKSLMPTADAAFEGGHEGFLFQGRNQRWRDVLTEEDITLYRTTAARELPPDLNTWLAR